MVQRRAIDRLAAYGQRAVPQIVTAFETSPSAHVRAWSASALAAILGKAAMPYLLKALRDPHMSVRLRALQAIASFNDSDLGKAIVPLLKDPSGGVRANALEALIRLRVKGVDHLILAATEDAKWYIRQRAIRAIEERNLLPGGVSLRGRGRNRDRPVAGTLKRGRRRIK